MIYLCIPTYNEARTIGVLLWKIRKVMADFPRDYQILVLDDASTDDTRDVLEPYLRILPLTVLRNDERQGYARSLERLLREAAARSPYPKRDAIITLQADFTDEPAEIPALVKRIEGGADLVTSAGTLNQKSTPRAVRWTRAVLGFLLRRKRWPEEISDPISGFRAYRIITLRKLLAARNGKPLLEWDGWAANVELLRLVIPYARRVEEAPVNIRYDRRLRESRLQPLEAIRQGIRFVRATAEPIQPVGALASASAGRRRSARVERRRDDEGGRRGAREDQRRRQEGGARRGRGNGARRQPNGRRQGEAVPHAAEAAEATRDETTAQDARETRTRASSGRRRPPRRRPSAERKPKGQNGAETPRAEQSGDEQAAVARPRRERPSPNPDAAATDAESAETAAVPAAEQADGAPAESPPRRRRRGSRGGRRRSGRTGTNSGGTPTENRPDSDGPADES